MRVNFERQVAVVTGAGRGLGRSYALQLAERGAAVVVNDPAEAQSGRLYAEEVVAEIHDRGGRAVASLDSVATREGGEAIVSAALSAFGSLHIIINNAGFLRNGYFEDLTTGQIDDVLDVHLKGAFNVTQPAWARMKEQGYGRIVMTSSPSGMFSHQGVSNYAAAKAGLYGLTKALSFEGAEYGIKVNAILPSASTGMAQNDPIPDIDKYYPGNARDILRGISPPESVAGIVVFLASDSCEISGEAFQARAGSYARVFVGLAEGWTAHDPANVTAEDILDNFESIRDTARFTVPANLYEDVAVTLEARERLQDVGNRE